MKLRRNIRTVKSHICIVPCVICIGLFEGGVYMDFGALIGAGVIVNRQKWETVR